jgi:lactate dehydrogenase-like 2-hydroxyacid dehydrogenase
MTKPEIVLMKAIYEPAIAQLERDLVVHKLWTKAEPRAFIEKECGNVRAAVTTPPTGFSRADFEAMPKLELVACFGSGYELIDVAAAKERNIAVTHTPDSTAEPVADLAMGMIVALMRRLCEADRFVRAGQWPGGVFASGVEVRGKLWASSVSAGSDSKSPGALRGSTCRSATTGRGARKG